MARLALLLQLLLKNRLHGDRGVIRARQAKHIFSRQPLVAHDRIDQSRIKGMPHVQAAGDIGGGITTANGSPSAAGSG